jgi:hypothetical protein
MFLVPCQTVSIYLVTVHFRCKYLVMANTTKMFWSAIFSSLLKKSPFTPAKTRHRTQHINTVSGASVLPGKLSPLQLNYGYEQNKRLDTKWLPYTNHNCSIPQSLRSYSNKQTTNKCHTYNNHITKIRLIIPKSSISRLVSLIVTSFSLGPL